MFSTKFVHPITGKTLEFVSSDEGKVYIWDEDEDIIFRFEE